MPDPTTPPVGEPKAKRASRTEGTTALHIRLPDDLHAKLLRTAETRDVGVSYLATKAVKGFLDKLDEDGMP